MCQQRLIDAREQRQIPVHSHGQVTVRQLGAATNQSAHALGILESNESRLGQWISGDDMGAAQLGFLKGRQHSRMIGAGILSDDDDQFRVVGDVFKGDHSFANANGLGERSATGLVAHI
jgi:hypothetical protein